MSDPSAAETLLRRVAEAAGTAGKDSVDAGGQAGHRGKRLKHRRNSKHAEFPERRRPGRACSIGQISLTVDWHMGTLDF